MSSSSSLLLYARLFLLNRTRRPFRTTSSPASSSSWLPLAVTLPRLVGVGGASLSTTTSSSAMAIATMTASLLGGGYAVLSNDGDTKRTTKDWARPVMSTTACEASKTKIPKAHLKKRMTSVGRFSLLSESALNPSIVTLMFTLRSDKPFGVSDFIQQWYDQNMASRHPRFHWKIANPQSGNFVHDTTTTNNNNNTQPLPVREGLPLTPGKERADLLARMAYLQMTAWDLSQSLWNVQVIPLVKQAIDTAASTESNNKQEPNVSTTTTSSSSIVSSITNKQTKEPVARSMVLWQSHHVLADGVSLTAALVDLSDEAQDFRNMVQQEIQKRKDKRKSKSWWQRLMQQFMLFLWFLWGSIRAVWYQIGLLFVSLWEANPWRKLRKLANPQEPHRTLSFTKVGSVKQAKWVARQLGGKHSKITVNDIFVAVVIGALTRQLQHHRERLRAKQSIDEENEDQIDDKKLLALQKHMNVVVPVHLSDGVLLPNESIGNKIGALCARVPAEGDLSPADRLRRINSALSKLKQSPAPFLSFGMAHFFATCLPASWASYAFRQANAGATVVVTNARGPTTPLHFAGREVESVYGFIPIPPGIPVGVTVNSYNGKIHMGLTAESWAVPDGDLFLSWVLQEYLDLIEAARTINSD